MSSQPKTQLSLTAEAAVEVLILEGSTAIAIRTA